MATVLIVEDNRDLAGLEARILRQAGHTPILAPDARTALQEAVAGPDLILLDLGLPDLSGEEVLRQLKSQPETAQIPVLVITGLPQAAAQLQTSAKERVAAILFKPFSVARLRELVEAALREQAAPAAHVEAQTQRHQQELIGQLIANGSDALVLHVSRRLQMDRIPMKSSLSADALTWTEIAEWARQEGLLDAERARLLRRLERAKPQGDPRETA